MSSLSILEPGEMTEEDMTSDEEKKDRKQASEPESELHWWCPGACENPHCDECTRSPYCAHCKKHCSMHSPNFEPMDLLHQTMYTKENKSYIWFAIRYCDPSGHPRPPKQEFLFSYHVSSTTPSVPSISFPSSVRCNTLQTQTDENKQQHSFTSFSLSQERDVIRYLTEHLRMLRTLLHGDFQEIVTPIPTIRRGRSRSPKHSRHHDSHSHSRSRSHHHHHHHHHHSHPHSTSSSSSSSSRSLQDWAYDLAKEFQRDRYHTKILSSVNRHITVRNNASQKCLALWHYGVQQNWLQPYVTKSGKRVGQPSGQLSPMAWTCFYRFYSQKTSLDEKKHRDT